ncbi:hypothetical protein ADP8_05211 (plasmid) [Roseomonas mucosa]|nr:hypothetical protein ADP8_05211 [Roseomonas mucosa]UZO94863.1 hypothetical protein RMP42_05211 [Roseomonas mucosa]
MSFVANLDQAYGAGKGTTFLLFKRPEAESMLGKVGHLAINPGICPVTVA